MNNIDTQYLALLEHIKLTGTKKETRNGSVISTFGRQIRHNMAEGFPLLTTKKMYWKGIVAELLWFLKGQTNIKYLLENDCHIWDGDAYKNYEKAYEKDNSIGFSLLVARGDNKPTYQKPTKEEFIDLIGTSDEFAAKWGNLGPIYGKQWRRVMVPYDMMVIDQISNLLNDLKTDPNSRRLMVNAWNVAELDSMVLPPCHYGFQCYTRELSFKERFYLYNQSEKIHFEECTMSILDEKDIPKRAISLMWNQRSVDTFLGLPFNIASYGLLLSILAELTNMIPDQLIGNLGDVHLYQNHWNQANEQCSRSPYELPKLNINTEFWNPENALGENNWNAIINGMQIDDFQIEGYESYPAIKAPLSN